MLRLLFDDVLIGNCVETVVDRRQVHQIRRVLRPQHQEACCMWVSLKHDIGDELVDEDTTLSPSFSDGLSLSRVYLGK